MLAVQFATSLIKQLEENPRFALQEVAWKVVLEYCEKNSSEKLKLLKELQGTSFDPLFNATRVQDFFLKAQEILES